MATQCQEAESNAFFERAIGSVGNGKVEIIDHIDGTNVDEILHHIDQETPETPAPSRGIDIDSTGPEEKYQHPPSSQRLSNNTFSFSSTEKEETMLSTHTPHDDGSLTPSGNGKSIIRMVRAKKKRATRPSFDAFFQKAAAAAAARLHLERRPNTRHGGRRDGTYFSANGVIKKSGDSSVGHGSNNNSSSSTNSLGGNIKNSGKLANRKRKTEKDSRDTEEHGNYPKKQKTTSASKRESQFVDNVNAATQKNVDPRANDVANGNMTAQTAGGPTESSTQHTDKYMPPQKQLPTSTKNCNKATSEKNASSDKPLVDFPYRLDDGPEDDYPLIPIPRAGDVLFGRGSNIALHYGNCQFRILVLNHKDRYMACSRYKKSDIAREIVEIVAQRGGRFLEVDVSGTVIDGPWRQASYSKSVEKTCQALREHKWNAFETGNNTPSPQKNFVAIPVEDPESIPGKQSSRKLQRSPRAAATTHAKAVTSTTSMSSSSPRLDEPDDDNSSKSSTVEDQSDGDDASSVATKEQDAAVATVANAKVVVNKARAVKAQMSSLGEGSRVAIYWPLDLTYYEGIVEDRLQDNFFYVRYNDGESEWLDLTKHTFKVISADAVPTKQTTSAPKQKKQTKTKGSRKGKKESNTTNGKKKSRNGGTKEVDDVKQAIKEIRRGKYITAQERNKLVIDAVEKYGAEDWELIASEVPGWTSEDCHRRWDLYLNPGISRHPFSEEEIRAILSFQSKEGNEWILLVPQLERRSPGHISDRWNRKIRKIVVDFLQNEGFTLDEIEGDEKNRINYHGYFEEVVEAVLATISMRKSQHSGW